MSFDIESDNLSKPLREYLASIDCPRLLERVKVNRAEYVRRNKIVENNEVHILAARSLGCYFTWTSTPEVHSFWSLVKYILRAQEKEPDTCRDMVKCVESFLPALLKGYVGDEDPQPMKERKRVITLPKEVS